MEKMKTLLATDAGGLLEAAIVYDDEDPKKETPYFFADPLPMTPMLARQLAQGLIDWAKAQESNG